MKKHGDNLSPCSHNSVVLQFVFSLFLFQILFWKRLFCKIAAFVRRNAVVGGGDYLFNETISPLISISFEMDESASSKRFEIASPIRLKPSCCTNNRNKPLFSTEIFCLRIAFIPSANSSKEM